MLSILLVNKVVKQLCYIINKSRPLKKSRFVGLFIPLGVYCPIVSRHISKAQSYIASYATRFTTSPVTKENTITKAM